MNNIDILKRDVSLLDHVSRRLGQQGTKDGDRFFFKSGDEKTPSLSVWQDNSKGYMDFSGRLQSGTIIDFEMHFQGIEMKESIKFLLDMYNIKDEKKELKKSPKQIDLVENFENYRFEKGNAIFQRFLGTRGVSIDTIKLYKDQLNTIVKELGFCEGLALGKSEFKDCIVFPCYHLDEKIEEPIIVGAKIRRADGEKIGTVKSKTIKGTSTGILYYPKDIGDIIYICEGEADYIILKMLGFTSLIANLGGVGSNRKHIKAIVKHAKKIICLYDFDKPDIRTGKKPGLEGARKLQEELARPLRFPSYPKIDGLDNYDINDLFNQGWREDDFQNLLDSAAILSEKNIEILNKSEVIEEHGIDFIMNHNNPIIWLRKNAKFYDYITHSYRSAHEVPLILGVEPKDASKMFINGDIEKYYDICYRDGGKKGYFNIFNKNSLSFPSKKPEIHPDIKTFIENLGNGKQENYEWIHKAILYKYTHLNDEKVPALIIHSDQGVGKGTFLNFLKKIFGEENTQEKLSGRSIVSGYDTYLGNKMIVEIDELETKGMSLKEIYQLSNRIKSMVFAKTISVNPKNISEYTIDNIAWFIITSNDIKPLNIEKSDRRYSVIEGGKSMDSIDPMLGVRLNDIVFEDNKNIENYIAWLFEQFLEVEKQERLFPLDNEDKRYVQDISQNPTEEFFSWFCKKYPNIWKISSKEKKFFVSMYREEIGEDDNSYDYIYEKTFNKNLPRGIKYGNTSIRGKSPKGYTIESNKNNDNGYFEEETYEESFIKI